MATTPKHLGNNVNSDGNIAQISFEPQTANLKNIKFYTSHLRFKCKRCATLCCKLGGPTLSLEDVERLKQAGYYEAMFLDASHGCLKNRVSGSCGFLKFDRVKKIYKCAVYHHRPALCRLYPFHFEKTSPYSFVVKIMPCKGINRQHGELVDERFIITHLIGAVHDLCS